MEFASFRVSKAQTVVFSALEKIVFVPIISKRLFPPHLTRYYLHVKYHHYVIDGMNASLTFVTRHKHVGSYGSRQMFCFAS